MSHADEVSELLDEVKTLLLPFIRAADEKTETIVDGRDAVNGQCPRDVLLRYHPPPQLQSMLGFDLPTVGRGKQGLLEIVQSILRYSVNTWDQGFMDKLYASTNAVGVVSELILAVLNTNVHVYQVSPALSVIEKTTARKFAALFGFDGPHAGGISQPGGSASNQTSVLVARNTLFPETKTRGIAGQRFVLFTSRDGHYSLQKAAQMFGFGGDAVISVPVDDQGRMRPDMLDRAIEQAKTRSEIPFYVNATAGTTVLGSYDPLKEISEVCKKHKVWMHVDASWGGPVIFSEKQKWRLRGVEAADSIGVTPHKMLGVPITSSFLLGKDMRQFHQSNTISAAYLFHGDSGDDIWDLADLTPQCGRKGDALKLALGWIYYGKDGYALQIDKAFEIASYFVSVLRDTADFVAVSENPPPCLQICFYYAQGGVLQQDTEEVSRITESVSKLLIPRGFMVDYAPGKCGKMFRAVVNRNTKRETVDGLLRAIEEIVQSWEEPQCAS